MMLRSTIIALAASHLLASAAPAQCPAGTWAPVPGLVPVPFGTWARAATLFDFDGPGPEPELAVFGGSFYAVGSAAVSRLAGWDGQTWRALPPPPFASESLIVYDERLIAAGLGGIYQLDGNEWTLLGNPPLAGTQVNDLDEFEGDLIACGRVGANRFVWRWDGAQWSVLPPPTGALTLATLEVHDGALYVGGAFSLPQGAAVQKWNGMAWEPISWPSTTPIGGSVETLLSTGSGLIAGGLFFDPLLGSRNVARWDGQAWHPMGPGLLQGSVNYVSGLVEYRDQVIALGLFSTSGFPGAARWDGTAWQPLGNVTPGIPNTAIVYQGDLLFSGENTYVWQWDGATLSNAPGPLVTAQSVRLASYDGQLTAASTVTIGPDNPSTTYLATYNGSTWTPLGPQSSATGVLLPDGQDLYIAVSSQSTPGGTAEGIAVWDGSQLAPLGPGLTGGTTGLRVLALAKAGPDIIAAGSFTTAGTLAANRIAAWNGQQWNALGDGIGDGQVNDLLVVDSPGGPRTYAAGTFTTAGGQPASRIACWTGQAWEPLGEGLDGTVNALASFNNLVIAGGTFATAGTTPASRVAAWDGQAWTPLGDGFDGTVHDLAVFRGSLYATGSFTASGATPLHAIARWNGAAWEQVEEDLDVSVGSTLSMLEHDGRLYLGGLILKVNAQPTGLIAELSCSNPCPPDITTTAIPGTPGYLIPDGVLNNDDFFAYLIEFIAGNLAVADLTTTAVQGAPGYGVPNGQITNDDFFYYLILFTTGC